MSDSFPESPLVEFDDGTVGFVTELATDPVELKSVLMLLPLTPLKGSAVPLFR